MAKKKELKDLVNAVQRVGDAKTNEEFAEAVDGVSKVAHVDRKLSVEEQLRNMFIQQSHL